MGPGRHVVVLGAGFGGLEIASSLAEASGGEIEVTLIDKGEGFAFGFSKLELMFGRATMEEVVIPYARIAKPGVRVLRETVTAIDPERRRVSTDAGEHEGDALVIALGADYDFDATPGLALAGHEFYSFAGAERLAGILPQFSSGQVVIGVCGAPFKCPPAPSECALLLDDELRARGVREDCRISFVIPFGRPVPPSPETSAALEDEFAARGIELIPGRRVAALEPDRKVAILDDESELPFDLFLGVPRHRAPELVIAAGITEDGYVPVDFATLETSFPGVYAVGDVATAGVPKAGVFAEGAARVVAQALLAKFLGAEPPGRHLGQGTCYIEFGDGRVGGVEIDFLSGPERTGTFRPPSAAMVAEKEEFGSARRARRFG
jgi:sulfide:quinone oxidoreductase